MDLETVSPAQRKPGPVTLLFLGAFLLIVIWLGLKTWRVAQASQSLLAAQAEVESLMAGGLTAVDPDAAESLLLGVRRDVLTLKSELALFMPLTPYLGWLPKVGSTVVVAPQLLEMADAGTETAAYAIRGLKPGLALLQQGSDSSESPIAELVHIVDTAEPDLIQAGQALERVIAARGQLGDTAVLNWRVQNLLNQMDPWLPLGRDSLKLALILPEMMGSGGQQRYLIIAQNEDELRPTGGFISGAGVLVVENGRILDLSFQDAYNVDDWRSKPYDFPPQPLYDFMGLELFLFRDANFWPDFPTSAETAMDLYSYSQDVPPLDGAIAVDQQFMQLLMAATGPIAIPDSDTVITSKNVIDNFRASWAFQGDPESVSLGEWYQNRKGFIGTFAAAIRNKIESDFTAVDPILLLQNMFEAAQTKHLQIYMRDPVVMAVLDELNWDGRLPNPAAQDFLMIVDTNVGYSKANIFIEKTITYNVNLNSDSRAEADLTINYTHTGPENDALCTQGFSYTLSEVINYLNIADDCYWNYLRVYTPKGSRLLTSSKHVVPGESLFSGKTWARTAETIDEFTGLTTFANFLIVPRAQKVSSHFNYQLPDSVTQTTANQTQYQLAIYKQAGTPPSPLSVTVTLPDNSDLIDAKPTPTTVHGTHINFELILETDTFMILTYR